MLLAQYSIRLIYYQYINNILPSPRGKGATQRSCDRRHAVQPLVPALAHAADLQLCTLIEQVVHPCELQKGVLHPCSWPRRGDRRADRDAAQAPTARRERQAQGARGEVVLKQLDAHEDDEGTELLLAPWLIGDADETGTCEQVGRG